ncbi:M20/M25/M40 family metallo-hydrolase [Streptacidiphilus monticola]
MTSHQLPYRARASEGVRSLLAEAVTAASGRLVSLSHRLHAHPETAWEEEKAARWTASLLDDLGFAVTPGVCDLPTAFRATVGSGPLHVALCAEYDALPGLGHACGHNIIAASAVGAAAALTRVADGLGLTVTVLGTPAEEGAAGRSSCWSAARSRAWTWP